MPLTALISPASRGAVGAALEHVFETPAVAELTLTSEPRHRRAPINAQMILLPLKSDLGDISRALGVVVSDCTQGSAPNRFDVTSTIFRPVAGLRYQRTPVPPAEPEDGPLTGPVSLPGFAEPEAPPLRGAPHLRLVKSD
ncbi:PAS domain-containing protein [Seohaeicola zhoushanensis]